MKFKLPLIAAFFAIASLTACGSGTEPAPTTPVESPAALVKTDTLVGTGAEAVAGQIVRVYYSGYVYTTSKTDFKGIKFDSLTTGTGFSFTLGKATNAANNIPAGFEAGIIGMKKGGKRTILVPAAQGFPNGSGVVPANSGLVFEIELLDVTPPPPVESPATLVNTDTVVGTGAEAIAGKKVKVYYTGWLYTTSKTDFKGLIFDSVTTGSGFEFTVGTGVITGFSAGVTGMKVGGHRTVLIPAAQGYGTTGAGIIQPNQGLVFDLELLSVAP
ncbi:MAG: FKBP-type peptidyl-prolyl cis-trans isomerase [Pseudomonadota bacterium]